MQGQRVYSSFSTAGASADWAVGLRSSVPLKGHRQKAHVRLASPCYAVPAGAPIVREKPNEKVELCHTAEVLCFSTRRRLSPYNRVL
jgi:hypothetical protein